MKYLIDNIHYNLKSDCNFSVLHKYGKVFTVFDQNDSGNISFGVEGLSDRFFIKIAGAYTLESNTPRNSAIVNLQNAMPLYTELKHHSLIELIEHYSFEDLYVAEIFANQGPTMKRIRPRAQGRAFRILKRTSHITIVLKEKEAEQAPAKAEKTKKKPAAKKETVKKEAAPKSSVVEEKPKKPRAPRKKAEPKASEVKAEAETNETAAEAAKE